MHAKIILVAIMALFAYSSAGVVPVASYVAPYASSYNAHVVNHAIAAPVVSAPLTAAYTSYPYSAALASYPYAAAYSAPVVAFK